MAYNRHFGSKHATFGEDTKGMDLKAFGDTTGKYVFWDASADTFYVIGTFSHTGNETLTGTFTVGVDATGHDVKFFGDTTGKYFLWDESGDEVILTDGVSLNFGTGLDVDVAWDGTNLNILPVADDTGAIYFGNGTKDMDVRFTLGAAGDYVEFDVGAKALELVGDVRIDLSGATIATANTDGGVIKAGTSGAKVTDDTVDMKFMSFYWDNGAASGDARGIYNRLYLTGAGGGGEALRNFTTVEDVAGATAHGMHNSLSFGASGSVTGLGVAGRNTLHIPNAALGGGTYAALQAEIWSDGSSSNPATATELSFIRLSNTGDATGVAAVDDKAFLFVFDGGGIGSGNLIVAEADETKFSHKIRCKDPAGADLFLMACAT